MECDIERLVSRLLLLCTREGAGESGTNRPGNAAYLYPDWSMAFNILAVFSLGNIEWVVDYCRNKNPETFAPIVVTVLERCGPCLSFVIRFVHGRNFPGRQPSCFMAGIVISQQAPIVSGF